MDPSRVFVIVPCYREGPVVAQTVAPLVQAGWRVVVVDDGSDDDPRAALASLPVTLLRHPQNLGQGAALQTGTEWALRAGAHFVVHFDADGQHDPEAIPRLLAALEAPYADVALGSRFLDPDHRALIPPGRRVLLRAGVFVNWLLTGVRLTDAHNGLRALRAEAAAKIRLRENRMAHATELLAEVRRHRLKIREVATKVVYTERSRRKGQRALGAVDVVWDYLAGRLL